MDRGKRRIAGEKIGADSQQEGNEWYEREECIVGKGRSVFAACDTTVDGHCLPQETPEIEDAMPC